MTSAAARMLAHVHRQFHRPESGNILRCPLAHFYSADDSQEVLTMLKLADDIDEFRRLYEKRFGLLGDQLSLFPDFFPSKGR